LPNPRWRGKTLFERKYKWDSHYGDERGCFAILPDTTGVTLSRNPAEKAPAVLRGTPAQRYPGDGAQCGRRNGIGHLARRFALCLPFSKEVSVRSDLFVLALPLYELFTGKKAFPAKTSAELRHLYEERTSTKPLSHVSGLHAGVDLMVPSQGHDALSESVGSTGLIIVLEGFQ
jgi:hypothetical protein